MDERAHTNSSPASGRTSLQTSGPRATPEQIILRIEALSVLYPRPNMTTGQQRVLLQTFCHDLADMTDPQIEWLCEKWRQNPENRFMPTPGQLAAPLRVHEPPPPQGFAKHTYRATEAEHAAAEQERKELDAWFKNRMKARAG